MPDINPCWACWWLMLTLAASTKGVKCTWEHFLSTSLDLLHHCHLLHWHGDVKNLKQAPTPSCLGKQRDIQDNPPFPKVMILKPSPYSQEAWCGFHLPVLRDVKSVISLEYAEAIILMHSNVFLWNNSYLFQEGLGSFFFSQARQGGWDSVNAREEMSPCHSSNPAPSYSIFDWGSQSLLQQFILNGSLPYTCEIPSPLFLLIGRVAAIRMGSLPSDKESSRAKVHHSNLGIARHQFFNSLYVVVCFSRKTDSQCFFPEMIRRS